MLLYFVKTPAWANAQESADVRVPIIMYHNLLKNNSGELFITPQEFENDLKYLSENGYHTVMISDLIQFVESGRQLPDKPVVLTFDDGYYNNYVYALPLLKKYNMSIVLSVIGEHAEIWSREGGTSERYGHATWEQIKEMQASGHVEIANHTDKLHKNGNGRNGCRKANGESLEEYEQLLTQDLMALQTSLEQNCGIRPECFTYPFGSTCPESVPILKKIGFKATISCDGGINTIVQGEPDCLFGLRRENRTPKMSAETILQKLELPS